MKKDVALTIVALLVFTLCPKFLSPAVAASATELPATDRLPGYVDMDYALPEDEDPPPEVSVFSLERDRESESLPAYYRSDQVSANGVTVSYLPDAMRNQKPLNTCWAFSALGACEASLIRKGLATGTIDLSERHLIYYFYNKKEMGDVSGGTAGDYDEAVLPGHDYLSQGNNNQLTMWHLVSWCGPVEESVAPYSELAASGDVDRNGLLGQANTTQMAYESDLCHVQNAYMINVGNMSTDSGLEKKDRLKKLIMEYGALGISYYSVQNATYDRVEYDSYYNNTHSGTNHAVQLVGWDDTFPKENFAHKAPGDGAWLLKNSWGEEKDSLAQFGYFWISYWDTSINNNGGEGEPTKYAFVFDAEPADNYDFIHQYDGDGSIASYDAFSVANRFTAGTPDGDWEVLRSVGIGVARSQALCQVEIYRNLTDPQNDPTAGEPVTTKEVRLTYPGYHTIPLEEEILLAPGSDYSVVFRFPEVDEEDPDSYMPVFISRDRQYTTGGQPFINVVTYENPDVSFYRTSDDGWADLTENEEGAVFRIKTYTDRGEGSNFVPTPQPQPQPQPGPQPEPQPGPNPNEDPEAVTPAVLTGLKLNKSRMTVVSGKKIQLKSTPVYSAGSITPWKVYWKSSNTAVATVTSTGNVKALKPGKATITVYNDKIQAECVVTVKPGKTTFSSISLTPAGKAKLKWKKVEGVTGYVVYRATAENGTYKKVKTIKNGNRVTVSLAASSGSRPFYYKIRAYKTIAGEKVWGAYSKVRSCGAKQPDNVKAKALKDGKIRLTWDKAAGADGYVIYRATKKNGTYKKVKTMNGKKTVSFTDRSLKKGKTYYYKMKSYRLIGGKKVYTAYSDVVSARG